QRTATSGGVRVNNNTSITRNRTDRLTARIRPDWYQPIGSYAEALLDYERGFVKYDDDNNVLNLNTEESILDAASLTINSLAGARRLSWKIRLREENLIYEDDDFDDQRFRSASLLLGYEIIPGLSPLALVGYEDNGYGDKQYTTVPRGSVWAVGFRWQPNSRNELEALAGRRFFGNTYLVNWQQRGRYLTSALTYREELGGEATSALESVSRLIDDPGVYSNSNLGVTGDAFLSKSAEASVEYKKARTTITISPFYEKRVFENSAQDDSIGGIDATWEWAFTPRTTFTLDLHWDKDDDNETYTTAGLQLDRELGKQATASIGYSYTKADSDVKLFAYTENAIGAQLSYRFGTRASKAPERPDRSSDRQQRRSRY
ncbi:MAG: hypothetical protein WBN57_03800, partial [Gammaproteobacteria bacterium]